MGNKDVNKVRMTAHIDYSNPGRICNQLILQLGI